MASSDEEDIDALRNAALASMKIKQAAIEPPQGIQVVSSLTNLQAAAQNFEPQATFVPQKEEEQFVSQFHEVPFELQQAVFQHQNRGRGYGRGNFRQRGFQRGRGRGRGFNKFQPPPPQSALIVIQVEGEENKEVASKEAKKESRPFFIRPQDKWSSKEFSLPSSSPTRPKDTSKFRRYDTDSDSDDEDEGGDEEDEVQSNDGYPENDENDEDADLLEGENERTDSEHDSVTAVSEDDIYPEVASNEADKREVINEAASPDEIVPQDDINDNQTDLKETDIPDKSLVTVSEVNTSVTESLEKSLESGAVCDENKVISTEKVTTKPEENVCDTENAPTPLQDEVSATEDSVPAVSEIRHEDSSVSNSYSTFSRFNRRSRKKSSSGEDSNSDSSDEEPNNTNSGTTNCATLMPDSSSESENESEKEPDDVKLSPKSNSANNSKESSPNRQQDTELVSNSELSKSPVHNSGSSSSSSSSNESSAASSSSGSESSLDSSSDSQPSSRASSPSRSVSPQKHSMKLTTKSQSKGERDAKKPPFKSSDSLKPSKTNSLKSTDVTNRKKRSSTPEKKRSSDDMEKNKADRKGREYSPFGRRASFSNEKRRIEISKSSSNAKRKYSDEIDADPEFDATNYRDETMYTKNIQRDRKEHGGRARSSDRSHKHSDQTRHGKGRDVREETRHFKDIGKVKDERGLNLSYGLQGKTERNSRNSKRVAVPEKERSGRRDISGLKSCRPPSKELTYRIGKYSRSRSRSVSQENKTKRQKLSKSKSPSRDKSNIKDSKRISGSNYGANDENKLKDTKHSKSLKTDRAGENYEKKRRKSDEKRSGRKSSDGKAKPGDTSGKQDDKERRSSIQEKLKKMAGVDSDTSSDSDDSDRSISSLSDVSSDSESGTWRNKKSGVSRDTHDIELERRRRKLNREKRRDSERGKADRDSSHKNRPKSELRVFDKGDQPTRKGREREDYDRKQSGIKHRYHNSKKMVFIEERSDIKKRGFEEVSSDSDSHDRAHRGVVKVVKNDNSDRSLSIPSLMDIKVSKPSRQLERVSKSSKRETLVIQVAKSSDEEEVEITRKKKHKKHSKSKKNHSDDDPSDEDDREWSRKQVVNVTFDKDIKKDKPKLSVYDRLGIPVSKKANVDRSRSEGSNHSQQVSAPSGKRIKLKNKEKHHSADTGKTGEGDELSNRIRKIQAKNAEILRRKKEVEHDKQKYG